LLWITGQALTEFKKRAEARGIFVKDKVATHLPWSIGRRLARVQLVMTIADSLSIAGLVLLLAVAGGGVGMWLRGLLPESHLSAESKSVINLAMGLVATMTALVLGLLIGEAHSSYQAQVTGLEKMSADIIVVDRLMVRIGPAATPARAELKAAVAGALARIWSESPGGGHIEDSSTSARGMAVYDTLANLTGLGPEQQGSRSQALQLLTTIAQTRWLLFAEAAGNVLQAPFLAVLLLWLIILFASFGLMSQPNSTIVVALVAGAVSVAGAVFLIVELNTPLSGILRVSGLPLRAALTQLGG
jgi:hypothetical protein